MGVLVCWALTVGRVVFSLLSSDSGEYEPVWVFHRQQLHMLQALAPGSAGAAAGCRLPGSSAVTGECIEGV